jgi:hypothetical protein
MSREDDFDDIMDSDETYSGQDDTSEPVLEDESGESTADEEEVEFVETVPLASETVIVEMGVAPARPARPAAKKKKKAAKAKTKPKAKAKKKVAKPARKPAAKKKAKKLAKKKTRPAAKKKKAVKARRKR